MPVLYNKETFAKAGLDPTKPPATWEELLSACDTSHAHGIPLLGLGFKDQWGLGRPFELILSDQLDKISFIFSPVLNDTNFKTGIWLTFFERWKDIVDHKCLPDDVMSLDMYTGEKLLGQGKAAMTILTGAEVPSFEKEIGADELGVMLWPPSGTGKLAGMMGSTSQTFAITSWASDEQKQTAADFIKFMHLPDQLRSFYETTGTPPADDRFDVSLMTDPIMRQITEWTFTKPRLLTENILPYDISGPGFANPMIGMITGQVASPEAAVEMVQTEADKWRQANLLQLDKFRAWEAEYVAGGN